MMKNIKIFYMLLPVVLLVSAVSGHLVSNRAGKLKEDFFCTANFRIHTDNEMLSMTVNYDLNDGDGFITINGNFYQGGLKKSDVHVEKEFLYTQNRGEFIFAEKPTGVLELNNSDPAVLKDYIPEFYITKTAGPHHVRINSIKPGVWIFTANPTPDFICSDY